jgi:hypothetical protein
MLQTILWFQNQQKRMATITSARRQNPNDFLKLIIGRPVVVKLNSGEFVIISLRG